jgi:integrase/recombinase XerD
MRLPKLQSEALMHICTLVDDFFFSLTSLGRSDRTVGDYRQPLKDFLRYLAEQDLPGDITQITKHCIQGFLNYVATRRGEYFTGNGAVRHHHPTQATPFPYFKALRRLFNWACESKILRKNPMTGIHFKAPPQPEVLPYSLDEIKKLLAYCVFLIEHGARFLGLRNKVFIMLILDAALRLKEIVPLLISDVNMSEAYVLIVGKGNRRGIGPFCPATAAALTEYMAERAKLAKTNSLWVTETGEALGREGLVSAFRKLKKVAGVKSPGGVHRLRHTAALSYLRATNNAFLLQQFLRHHDLQMTKRYVRGLEKEEAILAHRRGGSPVMFLGIK